MGITGSKRNSKTVDISRNVHCQSAGCWVRRGRRSPFREQSNEHTLSISQSASLLARCRFNGPAFGLTGSARRLGLLELQECDASMSCSGSGVPGKEEAVQLTCSWRNAETVDLFIVKRLALFVSCGRRSPLHEQRNERSLSISQSGSLLALCQFDGTAIDEKSSRAFFSWACGWEERRKNICLIFTLRNPPSSSFRP